MFGIAFICCCSCGAMDICMNREYTPSQKVEFDRLSSTIDFDRIGVDIATMRSCQNDDTKEKLRSDLKCIKDFINNISDVNDDTDVELYNDLYMVACGYLNIIIELLSSS